MGHDTKMNDRTKLKINGMLKHALQCKEVYHYEIHIDQNEYDDPSDREPITLRLSTCIAPKKMERIVNDAIYKTKIGESADYTLNEVIENKIVEKTQPHFNWNELGWQHII